MGKGRLLTLGLVLLIAMALLIPAAANAAVRPVIRGTDFSVSACKPEAAMAGYEILKKGGNAYDAAVAAQAVLALTDPAMNGVGSDAMILVYDSKAKKVKAINAAGWSPKLATIDWYNKNNDGVIPANDGLLSATVPAVVDAWCTMLDEWGTMRLEEVLQTAIKTAEEGFPISESLANFLNNASKLHKYPTSEALYFPDGKTSWKAGDILTNPQLGKTFRTLIEAERKANPQKANKGKAGYKEGLKAARDAFYKGDIAKKFAEFSEQNGGLFRYEDFAEFSVRIEDPVKVNYNGYDVWANASATTTPTTLFWLNILKQYDLKELGHNSAEYLHVLTESAKLAYADREAYLADMDFVDIPFDVLLSDKYAEDRKKDIDPEKAMGLGTPYKISGFSGKVALNDDPYPDYDLHEGDTSYLCIVDKDRNMVSFMPSLHSSFGCGVVMADTGIIFNCRGDYFSLDKDHPNSLQPHKRPRVTLAPVLLTKDGAPYMVIGSPGGDDQPQRVAQCIVNMVDFGMNVQDAIEAPRFSTRALPSSTFPHNTNPYDVRFEEGIPQKTVDVLTDMGHKTERGPFGFGAQCAIMVDPLTDVLNAGADYRNDAYALAK
ncbi:MAG: gamma-glutamyltransferase family protein [Clostridia bacterium]|nr:gamma-glutamyltransferase family protein [Clostridia bacterium]